MNKQRPEDRTGTTATGGSEITVTGPPPPAASEQETSVVEGSGPPAVGHVTDAVWQPVTPSKSPLPLRPINRPMAVGLAGSFEGLDNPSLFGLADALLKAPANVVYQLNHSRASLVRFVLLVVGSLMLTGVVVASFSGGYQYLAVPLKLAFGFVFERREEGCVHG